MHKRYKQLASTIFTIGIIGVFFMISLVIESTLDADTLIPAIFTLAVFLISLIPDGLIYGIVASLLSVLAW